MSVLITKTAESYKDEQYNRLIPFPLISASLECLYDALNSNSIAPSFSVPAHPNVRVFITHGGLMGTMESAYSGVPMVGIPLFGDQFHNLRCFESEGIALTISYHSITKATVLSALKEVLDNPR
jgi:hypothetical protein